VCGLREALFAVATENKHPSIVKAQSPSNAKRPKEKKLAKKKFAKKFVLAGVTFFDLRRSASVRLCFDFANKTAFG